MESDQDFEILSPPTIIVQQPPGLVKPTECPTFSGTARDSLVDFLQAVQKHAFEHERSSDDKWIAEYVGTRLSRDAMMWYIDLPIETRRSWEKLRAALVAKFGPPPTMVYRDNASECGTERDSSDVDDDDASTNYRRRIPGAVSFGGPQPTFSMPPSFPMRPKAPNELRGRIEVFLPDRNVWLGYLSPFYGYGSEGTTFNVVGLKDSSLLVSFVISPEGNPVQLETMATSWHVRDTYRPYLGVALEEPEFNTTPPSIPAPFGTTVAPSYPNLSQLYPAGPMITGAIPPQTMIGHLPPIPNGSPFPLVALPPSTVLSPYTFQQPQKINSSPTWSFKACTESSKDERRRRASKTNNIWEKAAAAVWSYDASSKKLNVMWTNDDGSEEQLEVFVQKPVSSTNHVRLSLCRAKDIPSETTSDEGRSTFQAFPAKLFFVTED